MRGDTHVLEWMPLVTEVIGVSCSSVPGQRFANIRRLTFPWSEATAFERADIRRPSAAMLKRGASGVSPSLPSAMSSSNEQPSSPQNSPKNLFMSSGA